MPVGELMEYIEMYLGVDRLGLVSTLPSSLAPLTLISRYLMLAKVSTFSTPAT